MRPPAACVPGSGWTLLVVVGSDLGGLLHAAGVSWSLWTGVAWVAMGLCWFTGLLIVGQHLRAVRSLGRRVSAREVMMRVGGASAYLAWCSPGWRCEAP